MVLWVFGYGSLIWRPSFNYDERVIGYIKDYRRVFYQGSVDHRGTIEQPGRTVTLEQHEGAMTWGAAFRVSGHDEEKIVMAYLDVRERAYDVKAFLNFYTVDSPDTPAITGVLTYIATSSPANKSYLGPASLEEMARQIATSHGPSGPNHEYLFRLEEALEEIGVECVDEGVVELANEVRIVFASLNPPFNSKVVDGLNGQHLTSQGHQLASPRHRVMVKS
ncbi:unnamed protein product [Calypogeia fissa]